MHSGGFHLRVGRGTMGGFLQSSLCSGTQQGKYIRSAQITFPSNLIGSEFGGQEASFVSGSKEGGLITRTNA